MATINRGYTKYWILLALAVLFIGPMVAAWSFYASGNNWVPSTINYGHLIKPPVPIQALYTTETDGRFIDGRTLLGKWMMLYVEPHACDKNCEKVLYKMRQIRLALGEDMGRIERVVATFVGGNDEKLTEQIADDYQGTRLITISQKQFEHLLQQQTLSKTFTDEGAIFLVDPLGNIMMSYQAAEAPNGIYKDLKRLLKVSNIG